MTSLLNVYKHAAIELQEEYIIYYSEAEQIKLNEPVSYTPRLLMLAELL